MQNHASDEKREETESLQFPRLREPCLPRSQCIPLTLFYSPRQYDADPVSGIRRMVGAVAVLAGGASSLVMNGYHNSAESHAQGRDSYLSPPSNCSELQCSKSFLNRNLSRQLPRIIRDPTPGQLVAACVIYSVAMNGYYHLHKHDRYQTWFIVAGTVSAFAVGWSSGKDIHGSSMDLYPWFLMSSLVLSSVWHNVCGRYQLAVID